MYWATSSAPITNLKKSLHFFIKIYFKVFICVENELSIVFRPGFIKKF